MEARGVRDDECLGRRGHDLPLREPELCLVDVQADRGLLEDVRGRGDGHAVEPFQLPGRVPMRAADKVQRSLLGGGLLLVDPDLVRRVEGVEVHLVLGVAGDVLDGPVHPLERGELLDVHARDHGHDAADVLVRHLSEVLHEDSLPHEGLVVRVVVVPPLPPARVGHPLGQDAPQEVQALRVERRMRDEALVGEDLAQEPRSLGEELGPQVLVGVPGDAQERPGELLADVLVEEPGDLLLDQAVRDVDVGVAVGRHVREEVPLALVALEVLVLADHHALRRGGGGSFAPAGAHVRPREVQAPDLMLSSPFAWAAADSEVVALLRGADDDHRSDRPDVVGEEPPAGVAAGVERRDQRHGLGGPSARAPVRLDEADVRGCRPECAGALGGALLEVGGADDGADRAAGDLHRLPVTVLRRGDWGAPLQTAPLRLCRRRRLRG
eukprot:CAMPEP_0114513838 /NCGR_PEP_ID=MMETSP0109-20121206/15810_1 /TAXON_ID=29199 /ORGANISM="Chlorarachnion reptans, Strain CCCM449" /LENGTH=438 /DNA_ID=CAMNT_0001693791 /DNA_START=298 /DNA_END=1610 /DNA_ORIENTATION=-